MIMDMMYGGAFEWVALNVAPEWILIGSAASSALALWALFLVLVRATRPPRRRAPLSDPLPAERPVPVLRVAPYVQARHRAAEWQGGRAQSWPGRLR